MTLEEKWKKNGLVRRFRTQIGAFYVSVRRFGANTPKIEYIHFVFNEKMTMEFIHGQDFAVLQMKSPQVRWMTTGKR